MRHIFQAFDLSGANRLETCRCENGAVVDTKAPPDERAATDMFSAPHLDSTQSRRDVLGITRLYHSRKQTSPVIIIVRIEH